MAEKLKKFFQKKKAETKFRKAGPGHKLTEEYKPTQKNDARQSQSTPARAALSSEAQQAAAAALARLGEGQRTVAFNTSLAAIQAQVRRELEAEKKEKEASSSVEREPTDVETQSPFMAVTGVYFKCPIIGPEILTKEEWHAKIREFLNEQLEVESGLTACLIIHTCNRSGREKVNQCVETLCKYLDNIMQNPGEEKYCKIRVSNRVFQERVAPMEGTKELLHAAGFRLTIQPHQDGEEEFYVFSEANLDSPDTLQILVDALNTAEPITLELERNLQVLLPSQAARCNELPPAFFTITKEELRREHQARTEMMERNLMLRTKAMREKDELREMKKYKYALIRVRFPDGIFLQGTFAVWEKLEVVTRYVQENLQDEEMSFVLALPTGQQLVAEDAERTLTELRLVPATILTFTQPTGESQSTMYLKPEVMVLVQHL